MPVDRRGWPTLRALANLLNCHRLSVNSLQHLKMPKSNTNFPYVSSSNPPGNLFMDSNQLVDSLTAHISLYHNRSPSSSPNPNPNPRSSILKWFSSLTVQQRQSYISAVDSNFVQILLQMQFKLYTHGHGFFIILPDLPSRDRPHLPSLCFRKSRGLLARVSESNDLERLINDSVRLFGSKEGERVEDCSCSASFLDSLTVCEEFVSNVDRFVAAMDSVSNGGFLRGEESGLGSDWVELEWLKAKGYYSIESFVANRLEVALRLAWFNCGNNGKKRGVKLKEKVNVAGIAANVFWRKKGCIDWWQNLDCAMRRKMIIVVLGKAAKSLTDEILKGAYSALEDEKWLFNAGGGQPVKYKYTASSQRTDQALSDDAEAGSIMIPSSVSGKPKSFFNFSNGLFVVQDILNIILTCQHSEYDRDKIFFSTLGSISTISDCIFRKLRGLLMVVWLDFTKLELLGEGNLKSPPNKSKEKLGTGGRKKRGRTRNMKKLNPVPRSCGDDSKSLKPLKDHGCGLAYAKCVDFVESNRMAGELQQSDLHMEASSSVVEMENDMFSGKVQNAARKSRKERNKNRIYSLKDPVEVRDLETITTEPSAPSVISQSEPSKSNWKSDSSVSENVPNDASIGCDKFISSPCKPTNGPSRAETTAQSIREDPVVSSIEVDVAFSGEDIKFQNSEHLSETDTKCVSDKPIKATELEEEIVQNQEQERGKFCNTGSTSSSECPSYEWPTVAPIHFTSINSQHLPAATDRLHLDVGRNWHNHFHQSFVPSIHQTRNPSLDAGCSQILSRPLPMSLDWPPMVRSISRLAPSMTCNYDPGFISRMQSSFRQGFPAHNVQVNTATSEDERKYSGDLMDLSDLTNVQELADECDSHWISEEEFELHAVSGLDYSQYFGGGVMYWNSSDHPGSGFSRPPSLSSDDSSWAWHEADMNRAVDDMVAFSSSYSTNGLASPTAASFCSPFDPLGAGHQPLGYVISGNEGPGKVLHSSSASADAMPEEKVSGSLANLPVDVEGKTGDPLPYSLLPPIIIPNMSRERSRSEFKRNFDRKSPCVPPARREQPRIKRPPSPVVLCVPRAPRPPPPSPVSDSRKNRGFPTVRSGSSSPRHWGMRGWYHDGSNLEEACVCIDGAEVVWPSWRNKNLSTRPMIQPLPGALLQDRLIAISQLARDQEHPDVAFPLQPPDLLSCSMRKTALSMMHSLLHEEIDSFWKKVAAENMIRKPYINWAVKRVTRSLQVLWPRSRTNIFGSNATGLSLPTSDVDLVICLPPVRNLEPIKEAGILEGRNGIKETCLQHAARYLANQEWVKNDSLKTVENTAIPIIMLVVEVPPDLTTSAAPNLQTSKEEPTPMPGGQGSHIQTEMGGLENSASPKCAQINYDNSKDSKSVRIDISFKSPSHTGLQTTELVKELTEQFPAATPLALVLKQFLADRSLDQSYSGGLSSYCLVLLITRFLQHEHHLGRPINQNFGSLLMDFLYFFGNVFDPRQMRISVQGSGVYINRERGYSIDPIHIDDPLFPTNNVGRNCFRIHQCIKAFSDAYSILENELTCLPISGDSSTSPPYRLLPKIISSIDLL
ncbi:uncharacterized protein LOC100265029 [Vitis vinifera]|nr:uncharacterized protein LOC100265029 [Vitis vinifera]